MNVNGSRQQLLLGLGDWARCLDGDEAGALTLVQRWAGETASPESDTVVPAWNGTRSELQIPESAIVLPPTSGEIPLTLEARRSAASDRYGNIYYIGSDRRSLLVSSSGSGRESQFWPVQDDCVLEHDSRRMDFRPDGPASAVVSTTMSTLTVTEDHYLVVAFARSTQRGFLTFDLAAGGPPVETLWPHGAFEPFDMAPRCDGGVWILERGAQRRLWELDRRLSVVSRAQTLETLAPETLDDFQPLSGPPREQPARQFPGGIDLAAVPAGETDPITFDPIALEVLGCNRVLLLDLDAAGQRHRVLRLHRDGDDLRVDATPWIDGRAQDFVAADAYQRPEGKPSERTLFITRVEGNQAFAFTIEQKDGGFELRSKPELFPLRLYAGRALLQVNGRAHYDSGLNAVHWSPIVQQPRARYLEAAEFVTPVFDAQELRTTWDRLMLDARIPAGASIEVYSRASDEREVGFQQVLAPWRREPQLRLRTEGAELPWLREEAARTTQRECGIGTWELLFQEARGRYLQLRLRMVSGNGTTTPRLRALRAWSPRFSWPRRFLPAVYREDSTNASFIERWLSNFEGTLTGIEERIVQAQVLFDPRTAPSATLEWLLNWFDIAFDPAWDERRRRLFVRRVMDFFRWRGTTHGLRLALELAFDECIDEKIFDGPDAVSQHPQSVRIVEAFATRLFGGTISGDPAQGTEAGPLEVIRSVLWVPQEGNAGLADRYARFLGAGSATPEQQITPFPLYPPQGADAAAGWGTFMMANLGFVPAAGAEERGQWSVHREARGITDAGHPADWPTNVTIAAQWRAFTTLRAGETTRRRWTDFLARRYRRIGELNLAWRTHWPDFGVVALPSVLPASIAAQTDWLQFERQLLAMHRTAHRFSVLLPVKTANEDPVELDERLRLAQRIVDLEKPAHTVFDVRLYWALNRIGEARLGIDTLLGQGSRAPELIPYALLGRAYIGASFVAGDKPAGLVGRGLDRALLNC
jgi:phage tail-like protein